MEQNTLYLLLQRQQLRCLRLTGVTVDSALPLKSYYTLNHLEELRFGSLYPNPMVKWVVKMVVKNFTNLQHLEIGAENLVAACRSVDRLYNDTDDNVDPITNQFSQMIEEYLVSQHGLWYPPISVSSLTLVGLSLLDLKGRSHKSIIDWTDLKALAFKSCSQLDGMLRFLHSVFQNSRMSGKAMNLQSFDLRSEIRANTADALETFLTSFNGLIHLGLLLEDHAVSLVTLHFILKNHGSTLRRFIWDIRAHERICFTEDLSRAQNGNKHLEIIARRCPLLEELGLTFDWNALMDPVRKCAIDGDGGLPCVR